MTKPTDSDIKVLATNRKATHDYSIEDRFEAGLAGLFLEVRGEPERGAVTDDTFDADIAAHFPDDLPRNGKPQPDARLILVPRRPTEGLEDSFVLIRGDADAGVLDSET